MNYTKEKRWELYNKYGFTKWPVAEVKMLVQDCDELEEKLGASRDSRILSAVPSEDFIFLQADYDGALREIGKLQNQLKDANDEIDGLKNEIRHR